MFFGIDCRNLKKDDQASQDSNSSIICYDYSGSVTTSGEAQEWIEYEEEDVDIPVVPYLGASMKF